jgi:hypothetical protein
LICSFRERKLANSQRDDDNKNVAKGRRHSHVPEVKNSPSFSYLPPGSGVFTDPVVKIKKREKSIEEIKLEYNQPGCQYQQIYHPSTQRSLQVHRGNNSIGVSEDTNNFSSKS